MKRCASCGKSKPNTASKCPACGSVDEQVIAAMVAGTPGLTTLVLAVLALWIYRFWMLGWSALPGNLRCASLAAAGLGFAGLLFAPMWTFGVRSRKTAAVLLAFGVVAQIAFNAL